jgi:type I restriction enzyme S subunit
MSNLPSFTKKSLGSLANARRGITYSAHMLVQRDEGLPYVNMKSFKKGGGFNKNGLKFFNGNFKKDDLANNKDLLIANTDVTLDGDIVGIPAYLPEYIRNNPVLFSHHVTRLRLTDEIDAHFLYYLLNTDEYRRWMHKYARGTTVLMLDMQAINKIPIHFPIDISVRLKIVKILSTIDQTIEKTEELIEKYQQIKTGLMQDLFTRGIGSDGKLRPPHKQAPDLYHETKIGWIPIGWKAVKLDSIKENLADGPFGSNLKTEHYVTSAGVRVVRLQNIVASEYNDGDKAFISEQHAQFLVRNKVVGNDILIAGLGEDRYPVGRACLYPQELPPAVNKADCFRLRCNSGALNGFIMYYLNTSLARRQISKFEQGVTRPRINTGNLKKIYVVKPTIEEQTDIFERLSKIDRIISSEKQYLEKLLFEKQGIMHDLLTCKKPDDLEDVNV